MEVGREPPDSFSTLLESEEKLTKNVRQKKANTIFWGELDAGGKTLVTEKSIQLQKTVLVIRDKQHY